MKTEHQKKVLAITQQESIPYVMNGIAADAEGHIISEDTLIAMVEAIEAGETAIASLTEAQTNLATAKTELATANASLTTAQADLQAANEKVVALEEKVAKYGNADGGMFTTTAAAKDTDPAPDAQELTSVDREKAALAAAQ
jgi:hypothetical protein